MFSKESYLSDSKCPQRYTFCAKVMAVILRANVICVCIVFTVLVNDVGNCHRVEHLKYDELSTFSKMSHIFSTTPLLHTNLDTVNISMECRRSLELFRKDLSLYKMWTLKMIDASAKIPSGLLNGNIHFSGDYDQCLAINEHTQNVNINGKYCRMIVYIVLKNATDIVHDVYNHMVGFSPVVGTYEKIVKFIPSFTEFNWGFCIPSPCHDVDLEAILNDVLLNGDQAGSIEFQVRRDQFACGISRPRSLFHSKSSMLLCLILVSIIGATVIGTIRDYLYGDVNDDELSKRWKCVLAFSLVRNWKTLTDVSGDNDIPCLNGIRTVFSVIIYLIHRTVFGIGAQPFTNRNVLLPVMTSPGSMIFRAFWSHVDTFVILSGLLTSHYAIKKLRQGRKLNVMQMYIGRYLKFAPLFALIVAIIGHLIGEFLNGPLVLGVVSINMDRCKNALWRNILFIDTIDGMDNMCYPTAHQLITDMQMYLAAPFLIMALWALPKHRYMVVAAIFAALTGLKVYTILRNNLVTVLYYGMHTNRMRESADLIYLNPIHRLLPYLAGITMGFCLHDSGRKCIFSSMQRKIGWLLSIASVYYCFFYMSHTTKPSYVFDVNESAMYGAMQPILWAFTICWLVYMCYTGHGGILNRFLSWPGFIVYSRIAYAVYMLQLLIIMWSIGLLVHVPQYARLMQIIDLTEIIILLTVSTLATMMIMIPCGELYKIFMSSDKKPTADSAQVNQNTDLKKE